MCRFDGELDTGCNWELKLQSCTLAKGTVLTLPSTYLEVVDAMVRWGLFSRGESVLESPIHEEALQYFLNATQTIPRKKIKRGTALFRDGQRDGPGGQINHLSDRPISMVWEGRNGPKRERVQDSSMPRPLLTNVGLSKGVLGVQANKISNLGTNHHRQKQQQIYNELQK